MIKTIRSFFCRLTFLAHYDTPQMRALFANLDTMMASHAVEVFKNKPGDTSSVAHVRVDNRDFVIKRYNIKGLAHRVKRAVMTTKARVSWQNALLLKELGIPSIQPVALIEKRFWPLKGVSYLITEYQDGIMGNEYFSLNSPHQQRFQQVIHRLSTLITLMKNAHIVHDDFQIYNILMVDHAPVLLDLDHLRQFNKASRRFTKAHQKDLQHFESFLRYSPVIHRMFRDALQ